MSARKRTCELLPLGTRTCTVRASKRSGAAVTAGAVDGIGNLLRHRKIFVVQLQINGVASAELSRQLAFDNRAISDAPAIKLVNLHATAACGSARAADQNIALRQSIHLAVTPFNGVINNVPPRRLLAFPIEETTTSIVCPCRAKGGYDAVTITGRHVFQLHVGAGGDRNPQL
ncbi:Uncharacterised protein [Salmonella enterica subsp. enterica]|nr:Uncharacterised protein [Salmonella enterica subsp. enterica]